MSLSLQPTTHQRGGGAWSKEKGLSEKKKKKKETVKPTSYSCHPAWLPRERQRLPPLSPCRRHLAGCHPCRRPRTAEPPPARPPGSRAETASACVTEGGGGDDGVPVGKHQITLQSQVARTRQGLLTCRPPSFGPHPACITHECCVAALSRSISRSKNSSAPSSSE